MSEKKVNKIFDLMALFVQKRSICKNGDILNEQGMIVDQIENLGINTRNLRRYLQDIEKRYPHIVKIKQGGSNCYRLERSSEIFYSFLNHSEEISWLLQLIHTSDQNLLNELAQESYDRLERISKKERDIFLFQGLPFDELQDPTRKEIFNMLKVAIKNGEYRDIHYEYNHPKILKNTRALKLIFMENNWYVASVTENQGFLLLRMAFIRRVEYARKETYRISQLKKYNSYLKNIQNSMTLYGVVPQVGIFLASPNVAKYFKPHMKRYLRSQKFISEHEDGSVEFSLEYTQPLEVLPFIKRWIPEVEILSPVSLRDTMLEDLEAYLNKGNHLKT